MDLLTFKLKSSVRGFSGFFFEQLHTAQFNPSPVQCPHSTTGGGSSASTTAVWMEE